MNTMNRKLVPVLVAAALLAACGDRGSRGDTAAETDAAATVAAAPAPAPVEPAPPADENVRVSAGTAIAGTDDGALEVVDYPSLANRVGAHVEITTRAGSVRKGTVLSSNNYETQIKLDAEEGGFNLLVPADTVAQVRLIPDAAAGGAATAKP
jgi:hypothetical protein